MGMLCLDTEGCNYLNRENARFCTRCGIPLQGTLVQGRYEVQALTGDDRSTVTLHALDRHNGQDVTLRVLRPRQSTQAERENFLQDAELALSLSNHAQEPGSIYVTDFGKDGPVAFLVKSEFVAESTREAAGQVNPAMTPRTTRQNVDQQAYNSLAEGNRLYELARYD